MKLSAVKRILAAVLGLGGAANGVVMLAAPALWYDSVPGLPHTGPFNPHFVRDIGCAFLTVGIAQIWAALAPGWRFPLVTAAALFLGAHALLHVYDTAVGNLPHTHWWLDLPGVYLPAAILAAAAYAARPRGGTHATPTHR